MNISRWTIARAAAAVALGEVARAVALALAGFPLGPRAIAIGVALAALAGALAVAAMALGRSVAGKAALAIVAALVARAARLGLDVTGGADPSALELAPVSIGVDAAGVLALAALARSRPTVAFALYAASRLGTAPPDVAFAPDAIGAVATFALLRSFLAPRADAAPPA